MSRVSALAEHVRRISKEILAKNPDATVTELIARLAEHAEDAAILDQNVAFVLCKDCLSDEAEELAEATVTFVGGIVRCQMHADKFTIGNQHAKAKAEREARERHLASDHADGESCEECCDHMDRDCGHCIECGKNCTEDMMAMAYDRSKDRD